MILPPPSEILYCIISKQSKALGMPRPSGNLETPMANITRRRCTPDSREISGCAARLRHQSILSLGRWALSIIKRLPRDPGSRTYHFLSPRFPLAGENSCLVREGKGDWELWKYHVSMMIRGMRSREEETRHLISYIPGEGGD
jgi:hypothetical protein